MQQFIKHSICLAFLFFIHTINAQKTPTLLIDGAPVQFQGDLSLPYWVSAGKTIGFSVGAKTASILEFNIDNNELQFNQIIHLTTSGTVPEGKAWKIEAIGLGPNTSALPTSGFSTAVTPTIFTSPVTYADVGTYTWIVPPGVTNICIEAWGGGGNGGSRFGSGSSSTYGGGGGGGGGYGYDCFTVTPGNSYTIIVGDSAEASSVGNLIIANGGSNGGGASSTSNGVAGTGGTSAANYAINGENGLIYNSGCNQFLSAKGGNGANGGDGGTGTYRYGSSCSYYEDPNAGEFPGGGGGGASYASNPGDGASGQIIIYF